MDLKSAKKKDKPTVITPQVPSSNNTKLIQEAGKYAIQTMAQVKAYKKLNQQSIAQLEKIFQISDF